MSAFSPDDFDIKILPNGDPAPFERVPGVLTKPVFDAYVTRTLQQFMGVRATRALPDQIRSALYELCTMRLADIWPASLGQPQITVAWQGFPIANTDDARIDVRIALAREVFCYGLQIPTTARSYDRVVEPILFRKNAPWKW